ncbi:hypothetical protein [Pandoraea sp. ISTKB]|uniref:hypothetical protein n=1 Tax=Pandoraea sp. ISTKB TaxID=1586708 RepID=UPI0008468E44|nr:hypothetical protein [Pandoraea sp. ISTKB]ODP35247.1 hypothetical protein A9762_11210 [Pandoraea sp. ISTKB]
MQIGQALLPWNAPSFHAAPITALTPVPANAARPDVSDLVTDFTALKQIPQEASELSKPEDSDNGFAFPDWITSLTDIYERNFFMFHCALTDLKHGPDRTPLHEQETLSRIMKHLDALSSQAGVTAALRSLIDAVNQRGRGVSVEDVVDRLMTRKGARNIQRSMDRARASAESSDSKEELSITELIADVGITLGLSGLIVMPGDPVTKTLAAIALAIQSYRWTDMYDAHRNLREMYGVEHPNRGIAAVRMPNVG